MNQGGDLLRLVQSMLEVPRILCKLEVIVFLGRRYIAPSKLSAAGDGRLWPEGQIQLPLFLQTKFS